MWPVKECGFLVREKYRRIYLIMLLTAKLVVPWLRRLVAGLSPRRTEFDPGSVHMGFVVDEVALGQVSPRVLRFYPVNLISPVLCYNEKRKKNCSSPSQGSTISLKTAVRP
jgi:hypothetical protein